MRAILAYALDLDIFRGVFGAASNNNPNELIHLGAQASMSCLRWSMCCSMFADVPTETGCPGGLSSPTPDGWTVGAEDGRPGRAVDQTEQSVEFGLNLLVGFVQRLEKDGISGKEISAQAGLFIDDQFDQAVCVDDDDVGAVDDVRAFLNASQTIAKDKSQDSESCNR